MPESDRGPGYLRHSVGPVGLISLAGLEGSPRSNCDRKQFVNFNASIDFESPVNCSSLHVV